ncbi:MAG: sigma 54-interacting transcriptional regulator [Candidatus Acidiferrum sp.]
MEYPANLSRAAASCKKHFGELIGESATMLRLYALISKAGECTSPVLLLGETGTGKELVARGIHLEGLRREKAFVPVDCSALTPTLIESELFGHVKGAFTGADHSREGLLQSADGGTIFLDEIGELPTALQAKLLRALQEREVRPVGSTARIPIDVRIIAATNRDLEVAVRKGTFRQDLFYRLNVIQVHLPPLRNRKVDIPLLVIHFLDKFSGTVDCVHAISDGALQKLMSHDWPGNIRELQNAIERAVALSSDSDSVLTAGDLVSVPNRASATDGPNNNEIMPLREIERRAILHALRETGGDKLATARLLGIGKTTLYRKLKEYGTAPIPTQHEPEEEN